MRVLPILFNTEMVRAIMEDRKTVTRRVVKPPPPCELRKMSKGYHAGEWHLYSENPLIDKVNHSPWGAQFIPPFQPDDILYVRETWSTRLSNHCFAQPCHGGVCPHESCDLADGPCFPEEYIFKATDSLHPYGEKWHPSIHMPKEAARIFLRVTDVRVKQLQEITDQEAKAEGVCEYFVGMGESGFSVRPNSDTFFDSGVVAFAALWNSTIKPADLDNNGWEANPWVWVISFERCEKPEAWP